MFMRRCCKDKHSVNLFCAFCLIKNDDDDVPLTQLI